MEKRNRKRKWRRQRPTQPLLLSLPLPLPLLLSLSLSLLLPLSLMKAREKMKTQGLPIMGRSSWMQRARLRIFSTVNNLRDTLNREEISRNILLIVYANFPYKGLKGQNNIIFSSLDCRKEIDIVKFSLVH